VALNASSTALAADVAPAPPHKAPTAVAAFSWTGFYIGGHVGAGTGTVKHSLTSDQLIGGPGTGTELRALRRLQREQEPGRYVFMSERGAPSGNNLVRRT
jgi:opacity protein-like surface antigen